MTVDAQVDIYMIPTSLEVPVPVREGYAKTVSRS